MGLFVHRIVLLWKFDEKSENELLYISEKGMV